jgi:hypothetical protein
LEDAQSDVSSSLEFVRIAQEFFVKNIMTALAHIQRSGQFIDVDKSQACVGWVTFTESRLARIIRASQSDDDWATI